MKQLNKMYHRLTVRLFFLLRMCRPIESIFVVKEGATVYVTSKKNVRVRRTEKYKSSCRMKKIHLGYIAVHMHLRRHLSCWRIRKAKWSI